jgi:FkbH-like protein
MSATDVRDQLAARDLLAALHRAGQIAAQYPLAAQLVAQLPDDKLPWAGRLLSRSRPDEIAREHPATPAMTVAITGHSTLSQLVPALTAEMARHGLVLRPFLADFDSWVFDLSDPGSPLYASGAQLTLCVLDPTIVFDEVPLPWRPEDVERTAAAKLTLIEHLADRFEAASRGMLVLNTLPLPRHWSGQLVDLRSRAQLGVIWRDTNAQLLRLAENHPAVAVIDLDPLLAEGLAATDARLSVYAKAQLAPGLLARYAREIGHLARHLMGRTRKCLALDLDNTLWGGVLSEDGLDGIEVADSYRGDAFRAFQRVVKQIGSQGVLLAAVSKNDVEPVREALRQHADMTVREDDFVRIAADWRPKHDSLAELADALNLGIDSFVFVDDSAYECGLVRREMPAVAVVNVDDEPALHVERLLHDGWFDTRELTDEDRGRTSKYRDELARKSFLDHFDSVDEYLNELEITVRVGTAADRDLARVSQLTLRTNQFNLTTVRLQPAGVLELAKDSAAMVLAVHAADRFGDNGLVGAIFTRRDKDTIHIENFLLSCRVFSRGIEQACLAAVLRHARAAGAAVVTGSYRPTAKNHSVADFYLRHGFALTSGDGDTAVTFRHDLTDIMSPPGHIRLTENFERKPS